MEQTEQHILSIENRKRITATQIEAVDAFSPTQIVLSYTGGRIIVTGNGMKITAFSKTNGNFSASGEITSFKYCQKGLGLKQRLFK